MADFNLGRLRFVWQGDWTTGTAYARDDVVSYSSSSYVCITPHTSSSWAANSGKFELMAQGGSPTATLGDLIYRGASADQALTIGNEGQALIVTDGIPQWQGLATADSVYYVKADGLDENDGSNLNQAFATIRYALTQVVGPATVHISVGTYDEILPLKVPANVTILGDGQRSTLVRPLVVTATSADINEQLVATTSTTVIIGDANTTGAFKIGCEITGTSITGTVTVTGIALDTPIAGITTLTVGFSSQTVQAEIATITTDYSQGIMWMLRDGAVLNKMYFGGMTGFVPNLAAPEDITEADIAGVFIAFDPDYPIINKSPYIIECASFSEGGIGAVIDGDVHATGLKSMVFHGYTTINSDGVGYWVNGQGKSEIVSCFTYYCWFGYTSTNGGKIRALNGNNSYGTYGVVSRGFDSNESAIGGALYGDMITYNIGSLDGIIAAGNTITGVTSGAIGTITNAQPGLNKFYYNSITGTFLAGETITTNAAATMVVAPGGVTGQKGFVLVADGFSELPKPGGSISVADDTTSYIIQSVSGSYTGPSSVLSIILANEKIDPSNNNIAVTVRYAFSQSRLTGHDFLSIGTGNKIQTNYPGIPTQAASQANEVVEQFPGRVFYVSTDQDGNFRVGDYFRVDQATGRATLNASAFDLSGLTSLQLGRIGGYVGEAINEFSSDGTLSGNSNEAVPTEAAVREYFTNIATNVVPVDDNIKTLGSPTNRWNHVYVGPGSITIGSLTITDNAGALEVKAGANPAPANLNAISNGTSNVSVAVDGAVTVTANSILGMTVTATGSVDIAGVLSGPAIFTIDPAAVGDDTGTVVIKGNLQVDGLTTTINSTTVTLDDKNIVLASGAINDAAADGAGITVESADGNKTWNWVDASDAWTSSEHISLAATKKIKIDGSAGVDGKFLKTTASGMEWADAAVIVSDITTSGTYYPLFTTSTSGTVTTANVTSTKFSFNPSTGTLSLTGSLSTNGVSTSGDITHSAAGGRLTFSTTTGNGGVQNNNGTAYALVYGSTHATEAKNVWINSDGGTVKIKSTGNDVGVFSSTGLAVTGTLSSTRVLVNSAVSALATVNIISGGQAGGIQVIRNTSGSPTNGQSLGTFAFKGTDSANSNAAAEAMIEAVAAEAHSGSTAATNLLFYTKQTGTGPGSSPTNTMTLSSAGVLTTTNGFVESSSIALKENVSPIIDALDSVMKLVGVTYDRKNGSSKQEAGLIAEEVNLVLPNLVSKDADGNAAGIYYSKLTAYLVEAIKSLKSELDPLKEEIRKLKGL